MNIFGRPVKLNQYFLWSNPDEMNGLLGVIEMKGLTNSMNEDKSNTQLYKIGFAYHF